MRKLSIIDKEINDLVMDKRKHRIDEPIYQLRMQRLLKERGKVLKNGTEKKPV